MAETGVQWFPPRRASWQRTRAAVDRMLAGRELSGGQLVTAELARGTALLVDSAARAQDPRLFLAASQRLTGLLGSLESTGGRGTGSAGSSGSGRGDGDAGADADASGLAAELAGILGAGASLGDGAVV